MVRRHVSASLYLLVMTVALGACVTTVNFDNLAPYTGSVFPGGATVPVQHRVTTTSLPRGITFSSIGSGQAAPHTDGGVFVVADAAAPSPPNAVCPLGANATVDMDEIVDITIDRSQIRDACDVWVTLTPGSSAVTATLFNTNGGQRQQTTPQNTSSSPQTLYFNACGSARLRLEPTTPGTQYCFDTFKVRSNL
jgi:hypothetical protein